MSEGIPGAQIQIETIRPYFDSVEDADQNGVLNAGDSVGVNIAEPDKVTLSMAPIGWVDAESPERLAERISLVSSLASPWNSPEDVGQIDAFQSKDRDFKILYATEAGVENVYLAVSGPGYWTGRIFSAEPILERVVKIGHVERDEAGATRLVDDPDAELTKVSKKMRRLWLRLIRREG